MATEFDWVPMFIHRLKGSDAWREFQDFQFGWYWKLIVEEYDRGGYLPADIDELWRLAGARTKAYFQREGQSVLRRFSGRTADGLRIYHPVVLEVIQTQGKKLSKTRKRKDDPPPSSLSLSPNEVVVGFEVEGFDFESAFLALWKIYPRKQDSPLTRNLFIQAVEKVVKLHGMRRSEAAAYILSRTEIYVQKSKFIQNLATYLDAGTYEQDESMWEQHDPKKGKLDDAIKRAFSPDAV